MSAEPHSLDSSPAAAQRPPVSALHIPKSLLWIAGAVLVWVLGSEGLTAAWYRWREARVPATEPWNIDWPTEENGARRGFYNFQPRGLGSVEQELLHFEKGDSGVWRDGSGNQWTAFYLQWRSDKRLNQNDLAHNPTSCLPAAGLQLVSSEADTVVRVGTVEIPFRSWIFSMNGHPVYVFTATRRERELQRFDHGGDKTKKLFDKLSKPWFGNRGNPLQTLQLVVVGPGSLEAARQALVKQVEQFD